MNARLFAPIDTLLNGSRQIVAEEWINEVLRVWRDRYPDLVKSDELSRQMNRMLDELSLLFAHYSGDKPPEFGSGSTLAGLAVDLSSSRAKLGFQPIDTAQYVIALKNVLTRHLVRIIQNDQASLAACLAAVDNILDRLSLMTFETYVETRERIITQQSMSLIELSTPVIRLWDQVILMPLIGLIDTVRARHFMERLLESIARHEALVTIIDVTGVPVFDTSVARHIMKAVEAAQLLGSKVVMTGLSPEGAQTLTKLNVNFVNVISRASLRAGLAEALQLVGRRVVRSREAL